MEYYILSSAAIFLFLSIIWSTKGNFNFFLKMVFVAMAILGGFFTLQALGYVVQI